MNRRQTSWQLQADEILRSFENSVSLGTITQKELAHHLGVSRQTVWRNKSISSRIDKLQTRANDTNRTDTTGVRRPNSQERIDALQQSLDKLKKENGNLTRTLVEIYTRLAEAGLNPLDFIGYQVLVSVRSAKPEL